MYIITTVSLCRDPRQPAAGHHGQGRGRQEGGGGPLPAAARRLRGHRAQRLLLRDPGLGGQGETVCVSGRASKVREDFTITISRLLVYCGLMPVYYSVLNVLNREW